MGGKIIKIINIIRKRIGGRKKRKENIDREIERGEIVEEEENGLRIRKDEEDKVLREGLGKLRDLRKEKVKWMDRIGERKIGKEDDLVNGKIDLNGEKIEIKMR